MENDIVNILKALADEARLRILGVLSPEPLSVSEVCAALAMRQSRVSRHLKILSRAGIVEGYRAGTHVYYSLHPRISRSAELSALLATLGLGAGGSGFPRLSADYLALSDSATGAERAFEMPSAMAADRAKLDALLKDRKELSIQFFQSFGADQDRQQQQLVDSAFYRERILALLPVDAGVTLDLGCGTGQLASMLATRSPRLICVDQSPNMLERARQALGQSDADAKSGKARPEFRAEFRIGALEHLPLRDGEADTVVASMILHHMPEPVVALREMHRVLRPGGTLLLAELDRHREEVMRTEFADFWLGFSQGRLERALADAGFQVAKVERGRGEGALECLFFRAASVETGDRAMHEGAKPGKNRSRPVATLQ
ncbi:MAG: metalloregulator ArsR/SmtB family transcription factor [bacterium]|nr:metalloregulator ArsR/SmtB family transcription factor [bacterium]